MASSLEAASRRIRERGLEFGRDDLDEVRLLFARHPDMAQAHEARQGAYEAIALSVSDPQYKGDLDMSDLGLAVTREEAADDLVSSLLAAMRREAS